ncbi:DUF402 domain-containing protein [Haloquadratum walsbyi]|jgi:RNA-binding protein AU-1|uniref:Probable ribonuclease FAU-1 n=1 Tax=Haloquadratum walsbyi J07HQW2 TaxID=1238425 RepID=U1N0C8_9EURY|nr:DUF402 domain-containing protein [Haloquadratum walsbyi]ERG96249.1 MAG: protein of unknown function (DUF402) [Haloquadratum walsbyi J07HQW2]
MGTDDHTARVSVRGIYATAVTKRLLDADYDIVQASSVIRERFENDFDDVYHTVRVSTTDDSQGVGIHGAESGVKSVTDVLTACGRDSLAWDDITPPGTVFTAQITETQGSGAICALIPKAEIDTNTDFDDVDIADESIAKGYLPYDNTEEYIEQGEVVTVQVHDSMPPWNKTDYETDAVVGTTLRADGGLAMLIKGHDGITVDSYDSEAARELAGMVELIDIDLPEGWGVEWTHAATQASLTALESGLERAIERAEAVSERVGTEEATPTGRWLWFGRESRFALDEIRRDVLTTMQGHHRIKAAGEAASAGVDLAEALCGSAKDINSGNDSEFPFGVVTQQFGPTKGERVELYHGKPEGHAFSLGEGEVTDWDADGTIEVTRRITGHGSGTYDALGTPRESGDTAVTKVREGRWWYPTVYRSRDGDHKGTYVNICTPVECFPESVRYVDLHVDVIKYPDGTVERVDDNELNTAVAAGHIPSPLAEKTRNVASSLERALEK